MFGGGIGSRRWLPPLCAAALLGATFAGCGGGEDESTADDRERAKVAEKYSAASESPRVFIKRTAKLLETASGKKDCAEIQDVNNHSLTRFPCPPPKALSRSMARFEVVGAEEYGTGAVVDYRSGQVDDGAAIVLFVAPDRRWGISRFGVTTDPSTESSDEDAREGYAEAVQDYLAAVRERDCKAFTAVVFLPGDKRDVCDTTFALTKELGQRMKDFPSAKPKYEGGNASYGFYSIETRHPTVENMTISVVATGDSSKPYAVLDVAPSPPAEEQELIRRQFEQQQRSKQKPNQPTTSPSRKAN